MNTTRFSKSIPASCLLLVAMAWSTSARTILVDVEGGGEYTSIQAAIDAAADVDEIEVGPGTYDGTVNLRGKAVRVYSGGGAEATIIQGMSNEGDFGRVVECISGEGPGTILEGFTVQAEEDFGIGLYCEGSGPTVIDCVFVGFQFSDCEEDAGMGWGIKTYQSHPTVVRCTFRENGDWWGGGMRNVESSTVVTDCVFENNGWGEIACGIDNLDSSVEISGCRFDDNRPHSIINRAGTVVITDSTFSLGSIRNDGTNMEIIGCAFVAAQVRSAGNSIVTVKNCTFEGEGLFNSGSQADVANCVFSLCDWGTVSNYSGSSATLVNCTFVKNRHGWEGVGGAIFNRYNSHAIVRNCIFWDNGPDALHNVDSSTTAVTYSNVPGGWPGEGNMDEYPLFIDEEAGDVRLRWFSPCVDAGSDAAVGVESDLDGNPRVVDGSGDGMACVDMGAYEYQRESTGLGTLLRIETGPQEAADDGAGWRLAGEGTWRVSGETVCDLVPGYYEVEFKELDGWFEPASIRVCVMRDLPHHSTVTYGPVGTYDIGQIPPGEVEHGATLAFYVKPATLGPEALLGMTAEPIPAGEMTFDPGTGLFVYRPHDDADVMPFNVTFTATQGGQMEEQTIEVSPIADLPAEFSLVSSPVQPFPDDESRDYLFVTEIVSETDEVLNGVAKPVRSVTIAGKTVVFEPGHPSGLYEVYSSPEGGPYVADIKEMTIYAETLVIGGPLHLPQTNVRIYARRLLLDGPDSYISTKPYDGRTVAPGQALPGLDGGDICMRIASFSCQPMGGWRFRVSGTSGPNGGAIGIPGEMTWTLDELKPLAWLSPYAVKMVLAHARDAYLYGYTVETTEILAEYRQLLEASMSLETWAGLEASWQLEFEQMYGEVVTLLHRLGNGLDYFGNPPGWVPMLSFEVTKAFYEQEINRAVRVLYLSYWVQNKAQTVAEKTAALARSREAVWGQTQDFAEQYRQIQALIPKLKSDAAQIAARIGRADSGGCSGLLCELKRKEEELIARADRIVQKRHEVPWWKKALKGLASVVTSTIGGAVSGGQAGAVAGLATGSISALSDTFLAQEDPWPAINNRTGVAKTFSDIDFEAAAGQWLDNFDDIPEDLNVVESGGDAYLQGLRAQAATMAGGMHQIKEALKQTSLSNEEVAAELKKIKAKDWTFNHLVDQVTQLAVEKEVFNRQLSAAVQKVSTLANEITNNLLAIDGMNRDASHLNQVLDPRATMYVKDMERRALERLQKYHYYLAKSYEYRLLRPSPMDLNLHYMFTAMQDIVSVDGTLDEDDFASLKTVYEEQLWDLTDRIYRDYQDNVSYEATAPVRLELSAEQVAALNTGEKVVISLRDVARLQYNEENTRIVDVEIDVLEFHVEGVVDWQDYFDLEIEHGGVSRLQKDGEIYRFVHYKDVTQETNPINWNERHFADGYWEPVDRSDASRSMLFSLLENCQQAGTGDIMLYARPGLWAEIVLKKTPHEENRGDLVIDTLRLRIRYDRVLRPSHYSTLQILTEPQDVLPYFQVDGVDRWGRQDGVGEFCRTYNTGPSVTVTAPSQVGRYAFVKWTDGGGNEITPDAGLPVLLDTNKKRIAHYVYTGPLPSVADFDEDFFVDVSDFVGLSSAWSTQPGDAGWDPAYDINDPPDGVIDVHDLRVLVEEWMTMP